MWVVLDSTWVDAFHMCIAEAVMESHSDLVWSVNYK